MSRIALMNQLAILAASMQSKDICELKQLNAEPLPVVTVVHEETHRVPHKKSYTEKRIKARNTSMMRKTRR